jgi:hypothetical protein
MASNINPYSVDGTFPVAGQDNSSQGFRDNFTNIKNNFISASSEITDLQSKAILSSALSGQTISNDMAGTQIRRPQLTAWTQSLLDLGAVIGDVALDFNQANFQKITTAGPISLNFINWPATVGSGALGYGVMRVWFVIADISETVTLPSNVNIAVNDIAGYDIPSQTVFFDSPGDYIFDFSSVDGGVTYQIDDVSRNRASFRDPAIYYNPKVNSTFLIGFGASLSTALELEQGQDVISAAGSYNSVSVGNLGLGNVNFTQIDTGGLAGYSVSSSRGNLLINDFRPVQSNDLLGYFNSIAYTGAGTGNGNVFRQVSSIDFFVTGANVEYGLGGNIAFFTSDDGGLGPNCMRQAVGIENDKSTKIFGNLIISNVFVPTSSTTSSGTAGQISYDSGFVYVCIGPGNWKRAALSNF